MGSRQGIFGLLETEVKLLAALERTAGAAKPSRRDDMRRLYRNRAVRFLEGAMAALQRQQQGCVGCARMRTAGTAGPSAHSMCDGITEMNSRWNMASVAPQESMEDGP